MTESELLEIERRCAAATEGPWVVTEDDDIVSASAVPPEWERDNEYWRPTPVVETDSGIYWRMDRQRWDETGVENSADRDFIAAARTDVPRLVAECRRLRAALQSMVHPGIMRDDGYLADCMCGEVAEDALK